jgi:methionine-gamma-lyase
MDRKRLATRAVHAGPGLDPTSGAHATPIVQTSTFGYRSFARGERLFAGEEEGYVYSRIGNPTVAAFERAVADLEGAEAAVAFSSGMAAIAGLALTLLKPGDEVAYLGPLYGGTEGLFLDTLRKFGVTVRSADDGDLANGLPPATRMVYLETPTNPTLRLHDLRAASDAARAVGAVCVADNTFATPMLTRPLEHGADLVLHSATKYLGGHGDALGGVLAGPAELLAEIRMEGLRHLGGALGPLEAFLFLRGLKTLPIRMERHCANARAVAEALREHPAVATVHWPGFPDHPGHDLARRQMGDFGGMVSLELTGGRAAAGRFLDRLTLFTQAVSLGDVESLATHPATTTHQLVPPEVRAAEGVTDGLVRLSIGIEDPRDLVEDVRAALDG